MSDIEELKKLLAEGAITQEEYEKLLTTLNAENHTSGENEAEPESEVSPARETEPTKEAEPAKEAKPESEVSPDDESGGFDCEKEYQELIKHAAKAGRKMQKAVNSQVLAFLFNLIGLILLFKLIFDQIFSALMSQEYWSYYLEDDPGLAIATGSLFFLGSIFWIRYLIMFYTAGSKLRGLRDDEGW